MSELSEFSPAQIQNIVGEILIAEQLPLIVQAGNPILRANAAPFDGQLSDGELAALVELMRQSMLAAPGVGLAAPQIGIPLQLAVLEDHYEITAESAAAKDREHLDFFAMINPSYVPLGVQIASHYEGCLSMSGWQAVVDRPAHIELKYDDVQGDTVTRQFSGWQARIVQHESDHLVGTLYIDKAYTRSLTDNPSYALHHSHPDVQHSRDLLKF